MRKRELRCIIAGFDPFGGARFNPSGELAQNFPDFIRTPGYGNLAIERLLLPTCCTASWKVLRKALKKFKDDDVVLVITGLSEKSTRLNLERVALNLRDYRIGDNNGHQHPAAKIHLSEENALFTKVPVDQVRTTLVKKGIPCEVSNHAGTFVCNEVYFKALSYQVKNKHLKAALFIHVPLPENFAATIEESKLKPKLKSFDATGKAHRGRRYQLSLMQESVQLAVIDCVKRLA